MSLPPAQDADSAFARGVAAQTAGDLNAAMQEFCRALDLSPEHAPALYHRALALVAAKDDLGAAEDYEKLLVLYPVHKEALYNLGNLRKRQGRDTDAEQLYLRLLTSYPDFTAGWVNMAKVYSDKGEWNTAELLLRKALSLEPEHILAHWNLSHLLLRRKNWEEAWREYEWRLKLPHWMKPPTCAPEWNPDVPARRILLWNDQGIGDAIQCLRYPRLLAEQGHEVWVLVQEELKNIAATALGVTGALGPSDTLPTVDAQAPLLSMPHRLALYSPQAAGIAPYLKNKTTINLPRKDGHRNVGLVWAGNQRFINDASRSADLSSLLPLFDVPNIDWFSLQLGSPTAQIAACNLTNKICDLSAQLHDFADTAAVLDALDLVICVDTSVAHLAGAMGRPCWLMLSTNPDGRWADTSSSSDWYPSIRLFRQTTAGDWHDVATRIASALAVSP